MDYTPIAIIVGMFSALVGVIWKQSADKMREHKEHCDAEIARLWLQIGNDSFSGMRKTVHAVDGLPEMVMELDRRVDRLERGGDR